MDSEDNADDDDLDASDDDGHDYSFLQVDCNGTTAFLATLNCLIFFYSANENRSPSWPTLLFFNSLLHFITILVKSRV